MLFAYWIKTKVVLAGAEAELIDILIVVSVSLCPFCILSGALFGVTVYSYNIAKNKESTSKLYGIESIGSIAGGVMFNFWMVFSFSSFMALLVIIIFNGLFLSLLCFFNRQKRNSFLFLLLICIFGVLYYAINPEILALKILYPSQKIKAQFSSPNGHYVLTEHSGQTSLYQNNILRFSDDDEIEGEETVHFAVLQHHAPKKIFFAGNGFSNTINEIIKYKPEHITYIEPDVKLLETFKRMSVMPENNKIEIIIDDPLRFLKSTDKNFDVIILSISPPSTAGLSRFYTDECFLATKSALSDRGVFTFRLPAVGNYLSGEQIELHSTVYNSLKDVFKNIAVFSGKNTYYVASDNILDMNISSLVANKPFENKYVNQYYIIDELLKNRSEEIINNIDKHVPKNTMFNPNAFLFYLKWFFKYLNINNLYFYVPIIIALIFIVLRLSKPEAGVFIGGFSGTASEFMLIFAFQSVYGSFYYATGLLITVFMAGLSVGVLLFKKRTGQVTRRKFLVYQLLMGLYFVFLIIFLKFIVADFHCELIYYLSFIAMMFIPAMLTGLIFSSSVQLSKSNLKTTVSSVYAADLAGAAFGAFITSVLIVPVFGLIASCLIIVILNIVVILIKSFDPNN